MLTTRPEREVSDARSQSPDRLPAAGTDGVRRELVRRIVNSPTFARSERLGTLLTYVCDLALKGREAEINEQKIGHAVFGRPRDYDSAVDGIVRSQASRLRQRLELYFQHEGSEEPIRVTIPRGGYVPLFEERAPTSIPVADHAKTTPDVPSLIPVTIKGSHLRDSFSRTWLPWGLVCIMSILLVAFWIQYRHQISQSANVRSHPFWNQLFANRDPTIIVAPDSGLVLYHAMSAKDIDLKQYLEGGYRSELSGLTQNEPATLQQAQLMDLANRRYTSIVDLNAILGIRDRAKVFGANVTVRYARDLRPNDIKKGTVILLGAYTADPWVELFEPKLNFVLRDDYVTTFSVLNRAPQKGEPYAWTSTRNDPQRRAFGIVAFMPNLEGTGNALLLEGIGMSGTEAAMDFLDDDTQLLPFLSKIKRRDGSIPHFQLVLETRTMDASAVQSQIVAWRVID